jgi:hypothetical protein
MNAQAARIRSLAVALMIVSISACGFASLPAVHGAQAKRCPAKAACCSGVYKAKCCGGQCCSEREPTPPQPNAPLPRDTERRTDTIVGYVAVAALAPHEFFGLRPGEAFAIHRIALDPLTLVAEHVRLQI